MKGLLTYTCEEINGILQCYKELNTWSFIAIGLLIVILIWFIMDMRK